MNLHRPHGARTAWLLMSAMVCVGVGSEWGLAQKERKHSSKDLSRGLELMVHLEANTFDPGEPIKVFAKLRNTGQRDMDHLGSLTQPKRPGTPWSVEVRERGRSKPWKLKIVPADEEKSEPVVDAMAADDGPELDFLIDDQSEFWQGDDIKKPEKTRKGLPPGRYAVSVVIDQDREAIPEDRKFRRCWKGTLEPKAIDFEVFSKAQVPGLTRTKAVSVAREVLAERIAYYQKRHPTGPLKDADPAKFEPYSIAQRNAWQVDFVMEPEDETEPMYKAKVTVNRDGKVPNRKFVRVTKVERTKAKPTEEPKKTDKMKEAMSKRYTRKRFPKTSDPDDK